MKDDSMIIRLRQPGLVSDPLTEIAREGAQRMLAAALKAEARDISGLERLIATVAKKFCVELMLVG